jgi:glycosyltransferase involved in cell wall biosynthesis
MNPEISTVMSVYNCEQYLSEAIDSILGQTFGNFEFIIIDDGSTDNSAKILNDYAKQDLRIKLIQQPNVGLTKSLNRGVNLAEGQYIARMDADDIALPERFEKQIEYFSTYPECVAVGSRVLCIDPYGSPLWETKQVLEHSDIDAELLTGNGSAISHPSVMIRRDALLALGCYREDLDTAQDLDLFLRLSEIGTLANISEPLLKYRIHLSSVNSTKRERQRYNTEVIVKNAYARRGIEFPENLKFFDWEPIEPSRQYINWAWIALKSGNLSVARKHAVAAIRTKPMALETWRVLYCAFRGR